MTEPPHKHVHDPFDTTIPSGERHIFTSERWARIMRKVEQKYGKPKGTIVGVSAKPVLLRDGETIRDYLLRTTQ